MRSAFDFRDRGELALKGIAAPVARCEVQYEHDPLAMLTRDAVRRARRRDRCADGETRRSARRPRLAGDAGGRAGHRQDAHGRGVRGARAAQGRAVLSGRCYDGEWAPPFSPFVEAIKEYAAATPPETLAADARRRCRRPRAHRAGAARAAAGHRRAAGDTGGGRTLPAARCGVEPLREDRVRRPLCCARRPALGRQGHDRHAPAGRAAGASAVARDCRRLSRRRAGPHASAGRRARGPAARDELRAHRAEGARRRRMSASCSTCRRAGRAARRSSRRSRDETDGNPFFIREVLLHLVEERKIVQEDGRWTSTADASPRWASRRACGR